MSQRWNTASLVAALVAVPACGRREGNDDQARARLTQHCVALGVIAARIEGELSGPRREAARSLAGAFYPRNCIPLGTAPPSECAEDPDPNCALTRLRAWRENYLQKHSAYTPTVDDVQEFAHYCGVVVATARGAAQVQELTGWGGSPGGGLCRGGPHCLWVLLSRDKPRLLFRS